jgi:hypothetical protein
MEDFQKWRKRFDQTVEQAPSQTSGASRQKTGANDWNLELDFQKWRKQLHGANIFTIVHHLGLSSKSLIIV